MWSYNNELYHWGIKGMKWGVRRYQNKDGSLTPAGKIRYAEVSDKKISTNSDGSSTIPKGFVFNRVGKQSIDVNDSGALYVSYGKEDAARYVKNLGPTLIGDPNYASESKKIYDIFREYGYDAIPDIHDRLSGTSETALIVINPNKLKVTSSQEITKDVRKAAKEYVKQLEKLKASELVS